MFVRKVSVFLHATFHTQVRCLQAEKKMKIEKYQQVWDLWSAYENALTRYVFKHTRNEETTKDVVQDSLLKVHKSCCSNTEIRNVRSWLFQIAHNTMIDFFKKAGKENTVLEFQTNLGESDIYESLSLYIEPLISFLPNKYARALKMADIDGLKQQEIANTLGITLPATKSRIQRARKLLKEEIHTCFHTKECPNAGLTDFELKTTCLPLKNWGKEKK